MARSTQQAAQLAAHLSADEVQALRAAGTLPPPPPANEEVPPETAVGRLMRMLRRRAD